MHILTARNPATDEGLTRDYSTVTQPPMLMLPAPNNRPRADFRLDPQFLTVPKHHNQPSYFTAPQSLPIEGLLSDKPPRRIIHTGEFLDNVEEIKASLVTVPSKRATKQSAPSHYLAMKPRLEVRLFKVPLNPSTILPLLRLNSIRESIQPPRPPVSIPKKNSAAREKRRAPQYEREASPKVIESIECMESSERIDSSENKESNENNESSSSIEPLATTSMKVKELKQKPERLPLVSKVAIPNIWHAKEFLPVNANSQGKKGADERPVISKKYEWYGDAVSKNALAAGKENKKDESLVWSEKYNDLIVRVFDKLDQSGWVRDKLVYQIDHSRKVALTSIAGTALQ
jgi:hypothetical protein